MVVAPPAPKVKRDYQKEAKRNTAKKIPLPHIPKMVEGVIFMARNRPLRRERIWRSWLNSKKRKVGGVHQVEKKKVLLRMRVGMVAGLARLDGEHR